MALSGMQRTRLIIALVYVVVLAGLGCYDERPDPRRVEEMARPLPAIAEPGNAWLAILGFSASPGEQPVAYGEELLRKSHAIQTKDPDAVAWVPDEGKSRLEFQGELPRRCDYPDNMLLEYATQHPDEVATLARDNEELLRRYAQLGSFRRYNEPLDDGFSAPIPQFSPLRKLRELTFLQLAVGATRGNVATALKRLKADTQFWRFVAASSRTLISKLIAYAQLRDGLRFAGELGTTYPLNDAEWSVMGEILRPFEDGEVSLVKAIRGETRYMLSGVNPTQHQAAQSWTLDRLLYKLEATKNRLYDDHQDYIRLAGLSPQQFAQALLHRESGDIPSCRLGLPSLYNPVGEIFHVIAQGSGMQKYIEKGYDLEGLRRVVSLKVLSRRERVQATEMPEYLEAHKVELGNPYTGKAMNWDTEKQKIVFRGIEGAPVIELGF